MAYAKRMFGAQGINKKQIALDVGYAPSVANSIVDKIESRPGFNNAMARLAADSNNLVLAAMHEFKVRGFSDYSNKDLNGALNAITGAWAKFNESANNPGKNMDGPGTKLGNNRLRTVILQRVENQVVNTTKEEVIPKEEEEVTLTEEEKTELDNIITDQDDPMDF